MKKAQPDYTVTELYRIFEVNVSSYYYQPKPCNTDDIALMLSVKSIFVDSGNTYGKRRIQAELHSLDNDVGLHKTATLMKK